MVPTFRVRLIKSFFCILIGLCVVSPVRAQESASFPSSYVPGRVLVRYTDTAASTLFTQEPVMLPKKEQSRTIWQTILGWLGFRSSEAELTLQQQVYQQAQEIRDHLSIQSEQGLQRVQLSARTLQLGRGNFLPTLSTDDDPLQHVYVVTFSKGTVEDAVARFKQSGLVIDAQPDYVYTASRIPNDAQYSQMWAHQRIQSEQAWNTTTGSNTVIVAVTDSGIDYTHQDLAAAMWNGDTGQGNGYGFDYVDNDADPMDQNGHGTHVAGIIGAVGNNGLGITGVNWNVKLMALRVLDPSGGGNTTTVSQGIRFAADHGAQVINVSLGALGSCNAPDAVVGAAISYAMARGALVVVATGNSAVNAACDAPANDPNVLAVVARGPDDVRAGYTNYGLLSWKETKLLSAPGGNAASSNACTAALCILSTQRGNTYGVLQGTSFSSPYVAGVAALVLSHTAMTPSQLRTHLISTADDLADDFTTQINPGIPGDDGRRSYGKRVNAGRAIAALAVPTATPTVPVTLTPLPTATAAPTITATPSRTATPIIPTLTPTSGVPSPTGVISTSTPTQTLTPTMTPGLLTPTLTPSLPTSTPGPLTPSIPVPTPTSSVTKGEVDVWVVVRKNGKKTRLADGASVDRKDNISICYHRAAGPFRLTIERDGGKRRVYRARNRRSARNRCLTVRDRHVFQAGTLFQADGKLYRITLKSGGKSASVTLRVTR